MIKLESGHSTDCGAGQKDDDDDDGLLDWIIKHSRLLLCLF